MANMSAPAAISPQRPAQAASPDRLELAVVLAKREHDQLHGEWQQHERKCLRCFFGARCRVATVLADAADDAGKRWRLAEERLGWPETER